MKKEKPDTTQMGNSHERLCAVKKLEKKLHKKLRKVPILNGYVMTNVPDKWEPFKVLGKNGNTRLSNRKVAKAHQDGG